MRYEKIFFINQELDLIGIEALGYINHYIITHKKEKVVDFLAELTPAINSSSVLSL